MSTEGYNDKKIYSCKNVLGNLLNKGRTCCRRGCSEAVSSAHEDTGWGYLHPVELCWNHLWCLSPFLPCWKFVLDSRLLETSLARRCQSSWWTFCPWDRNLGHTAHHPQSTWQTTPNMLVDQLQQFHYKRALILTIIRIQTDFSACFSLLTTDTYVGCLIQVKNCHYPLPLLSLYVILKSLPRKGNKMLSCCRAPQAYQLFCFCLICYMWLTPLRFCLAESVTKNILWVHVVLLQRWRKVNKSIVFIITVFPKNSCSQQTGYFRL